MTQSPSRQAKVQFERPGAVQPPLLPRATWRTRLPFFYGWVVVASVVVTLAIAYGVYYSFSVFYVALLEEFGWSRGAAAGVFSVFVLVTAFAGIGGGALIDRLGPSRVVPAGGILLSVGLFAASQLSQLWEFYLYFGLLCGLGLALGGWVSGITVVSRWFSAKGGLAMGIAAGGVGIGIVVFAPFSQHLISTLGWRSAYLALAALALVGIVPQAALLQVGRPEELGLKPDGAEGTTDPDASRKTPRRQPVVVDPEWVSRPWSLASAMRTPRLWLLTASICLTILANQMLWVHQVAFLVDGGCEKMLAASVAGLAGLLSIPGKILWGGVGDRLGRELSLTLGAVAMVLGILLLVLTRIVPAQWLLFIYAAAFSTGYAAASITVSAATADLFAGRNFGSIYGFVCMGQGVGGAFGAWVAGFIFDVSGSYLAAFALGAASFAAGTALLWAAAPRLVRRVSG